MNDETKAELMKRTREWLQSCVNAATRSGVPEEADLETFVLAHIDGEPARLAAAREEQREVCARVVEDQHLYMAGTHSATVRSAPLTTTPLADELRTLRARVAELEGKLGEWAEKDGNSPGYNLEKAKMYGRIAHDERKRAETAEARVAELEAQLGGMTEQWKAELNHANAWMRKFRAAEAQVAAARAECAALETEHLYTRDIECGVSIAAGRVLRAMDEATKK